MPRSPEVQMLKANRGMRVALFLSGWLYVKGWHAGLCFSGSSECSKSYDEVLPAPALGAS